MNTWDGRQLIVRPSSNIEWLREREKKRWEFAMHKARRDAGRDEYSDEPCGVTVGEWFAGR